MNKCLIISNQNIYDLININGLINYLSNNYNYIYLLIKPENINNANIIFYGSDNLILTVNNNFENINNIDSSVFLIFNAIFSSIFFVVWLI